LDPHKSNIRRRSRNPEVALERFLAEFCTAKRYFPPHPGQSSRKFGGENVNRKLFFLFYHPKLKSSIFISVAEKVVKRCNLGAGMQP
jgi:hypothetical protein